MVGYFREKEFTQALAFVHFDFCMFYYKSRN